MRFECHRCRPHAAPASAPGLDLLAVAIPEMKSSNLLRFLFVVCTGCATVETDARLNAELRALPDHSLVKIGIPAVAHDCGSTSIDLGFPNGQTFTLRCLCDGNLLIGNWKTNDWGGRHLGM
jgi:hypothetical protein